MLIFCMIAGGRKRRLHLEGCADHHQAGDIGIERLETMLLAVAPRGISLLAGRKFSSGWSSFIGMPPEDAVGRYRACSNGL